MNDDRFLKPIKGAIVRDPITFEPLSQDGEVKPWGGRPGIYWRRRVNEGTVIISKRPKKITVVDDKDLFNQKKFIRDGGN